MKKKVKEKKCNRCGSVKPIEEFPKGRGAVCKVCKRPIWNAKSKKKYSSPVKKLKARAYNQLHKERIKTLRREREDKNREKIREKQRIYENENRDKLNEKRRKRYAENANCKTMVIMRRNIKRLIMAKGYKKIYKSQELIGCPPELLRKHIESLFTDGMSWDLYGYEGIHIDHKVPGEAFDLNIPDHQKMCCHYLNLRPLWGKENQKKNKFYSISLLEDLILDLFSIGFFNSKQEAIDARQQIIDNSVKKGILKYDNETEYRVRRESAQGAEVSPRKDRVFAGEQGRQEDVRISA